MELSTKMCPEGEEGKYIVFSMFPKTAGNMFMNYFVAYNLTHFVYLNKPLIFMPFCLMGIVALITAISLFLLKNKLQLES